MKKLYFLILLITPLITSAQGPWDFTNSDDGWNAAGLTLSNGATAITLTTVDGDGSLKNPIFSTTEAGVETSTTPIIAITLRNNEATGPDFLRVSYPKVDSGRNYVNQDISTNDSNFVTYYFNLYNATNWTGTINDIKLHFKSANNTNYILPPSPNNISIDIDKIEFLASIPITQKESYLFDNNGDTEYWQPTNATASVSGGNLTITPTPDKFGKIVQERHFIDADSNGFVHFKISNQSASNNAIRFNNAAGQLIKEIEITTSNGTSFVEYHEDLSTSDRWTGNMDGLQISIRDTNNNNLSSAGDLIIDYITFNNNATLSDDEVDFKEDVNISLYPNPATDILNIKTNNKTTINKIEVYNILGQKILQQADNNNTIIISGFTKGVYFAKIYQDNNVVSTKRFIKE